MPVRDSAALRAISSPVFSGAYPTIVAERLATLTARQWEALDFIASCIEENGAPPTLREIATAMGIRSTNGVNDHLRALVRKGVLEICANSSRGLRIPGVRWRMVPA